MQQNIADEFYDDGLNKDCTYEVHCIRCGDLAMYANPKYHEGLQLPDMICIPCKNTTRTED